MKLHWFFKVLIVASVALFLGLVFYFGLPALLPVQQLKNTEVYGLILSDQVWEGEIRVTGDIFSPANTTVTIKPGTLVKVAITGDKSNMDFLPWHQKSGVNTGPFSRGVQNGEPFWDEGEKIQIHLNNLIVDGNFSSPVVFKSDSIDPSPYDYNIIKVRKGHINNGVFSDYRKFEIGGDTLIENSKFSDTGECSLCMDKGKPRIFNNNFGSGLRQSILVYRASPEIDNNLFINLDGDGIRVDARRLSVPLITRNSFEMPARTAIDFITGGQLEEGLIARNFFSGNSLISVACDSAVKIRDNIILGQFSFTSGCNGSFVFGPNYWGTPNPSIILKEKILNKHDSFDIKIPNVLLNPPKDAGRQ
jgi:hypothetical protein